MNRLVFLFVTLLASTLCSAQDTAPDSMYKPFATLYAGDGYNIGIAHGDLDLDIVLASYPQRGALSPLSYRLQLDTPSFQQNYTCDDTLPVCYLYVGIDNTADNRGVQLNMHDENINGYGYLSVNNYPEFSQRGFNTYFTENYVAGSGNAGHMLLHDANNWNVMVAEDGTGVKAVASGAGNSYNYGAHDSFVNTPIRFYTQHGVYQDVMNEIDANGNAIVNPSSYQDLNVHDTVGRALPTQTGGEPWFAQNLPGDPNCGQKPNQPNTYSNTFLMPGFGTVTLCYTTVHYHTGWYGSGVRYDDPFGIMSGSWPPDEAEMPMLPGELAYNSYETLLNDPDAPFTFNIDEAGQFYALQAVILPNGTRWGFEYDSSVVTSQNGYTYSTEAYGALKRMTYPSGGSVVFTTGYEFRGYGMSSPVSGISPGDLDMTQAFSMVPYIQKVERFDGTTKVGSHTYARTPTVARINNSAVMDKIAEQVADTDMDGHTVVHFMEDFTQSKYTQVYETRADYYDGPPTGNPIKSVVTGYQYQIANPAYLNNPQAYLPIALNVLPNRIDTYTYGQLQTSLTRTFPFVANGVWIICDGFAVNNCAPTPTYPIYSARPSTETLKDGNGTTLWSHQQTYYSDTNPAYKDANLLTLPSSDKLFDSGGNLASETDFGYDEANGSPTGVRGNLTSVHRWLNTGSPVVTSTVYTSAGMPSAVIDAKGVATTTMYDGSGLYPQTITLAAGTNVALPSAFTYDFYSGRLLSTQDANDLANARPGTTLNYDNGGNLLSVARSDTNGSLLAKTSYDYHNFALPLTLTTTLSADPDPAIDSTLVFDAFGRPVQKSTANSTVETTYNAEGGIGSVSNPHLTIPSSTDGQTTYAYDVFGRPLAVCLPDNGAAQGVPCNVANSSMHWSYSANRTSATDTGGQTTVSDFDVLGRLIRVTDAAQSVTTYGYDVLGNLQTVVQFGNPASACPGTACLNESTPRVRRFTYDSLSRLTAACNPEALPSGQSCDGTHWSMTYAYDPNGNVQTTTDSSNRTLNYTYDALNRITTKTSPTDADTQNHWLYDQVPNALGRMWAQYVQDEAGTTLAYDPLGRVTSTSWFNYAAHQWQSGVTGITYDLASHLTGLTYPDGRTLAQTYDGVGQLLKVTDASANQTPFDYYEATSYTAAGSVEGVKLGGTVTQFNSYNSRLQLCLAKNATPALPGYNDLTQLPTASANLLSLSMAYGDGQAAVCGNESHNNGNIARINDNLQPGRKQTFGYDQLNRLTSAFRADLAYNDTYTYDSFGNLLPSENLAYSIEPGSNRLLLNTSDLGYSATGTLVTSPYHSMAYTAEDRLRCIDGCQTGSYLYDAPGNRTLAVRSVGSTSSWNEYIYLDGQPVADIDNNGKWSDYIYANGQKIAKADHPSSGPQVITYYVSDHLGTTQLELSASGTLLWQGNFRPFGQETGQAPAPVSTQAPDGTNMRFKFTGKERDQESGLDYFGARYYGSSMGRWMSPDPYGNSVADFANPQSWNMYSYVLNNPLKYVDPTGLDCAYLNDAGDGIESSDRNSGIGECNSNGGYWVSGAVNSLSVDSSGGYHFGNTSSDANGNLQVTVYDKYLGPNTDNSLSSAYGAASSLLSDFLTGNGPDVRNYDLSTIEGRNLLQSKGIQQLNARIKAGCANGQQSGPVDLSSGQAAANIPYDAAHSPVGGQVGGYAGGTYTNNGDSTDISFSNDAGAHSFLYHATPDRPSGSTGPGRSITQNFTLSEPNPCTHP